MGSKNSRLKVNVSHCSQCQGDTEYHCLTCGHNLCPSCKRSHVMSLDTKHHDVMFYREKFKSISNSETCAKHPDQVYEMFCEPCNLPVCFHCKEHEQHKLQNIKTTYEKKRRQNKGIIIKIRSETLYNAKFLQTVVKSDVTTCRNEMVNIHFAMSTKSLTLKNSMNTVSSEISVIYKCLLINKIRKQMMKMKKYLTLLQMYENLYEQSANRFAKFLRFIKKVRFPRIQDTPHLPQHCRLSLTQDINMEDLIELLSELQITEGEKRKLQAENELLMTLLRCPVLQKSIKVKGVYDCNHISCVTPDRIWISDEKKLILTDTRTGDILYSVDDSSYSLSGLHTVNSECELIYISKYNTIKILSSDMKTTSTFVKIPRILWEPRCVYCSSSTGDLLVGMWKKDAYIGQVLRYNNTGKHTQTIPQDNSRKHTQTIPHDNTFHSLYRDPTYVTENNNMDVLVSDYDIKNGRRALVVTDCGGRHRFSYTGHPSGSGLRPLGICTDALSNILVCDANTRTVQMINKDGEYILCVGSEYNTVSLIRYINRHFDLTDGVELSDNVNISRRQKSTKD